MSVQLQSMLPSSSTLAVSVDAFDAYAARVCAPAGWREYYAVYMSDEAHGGIEPTREHLAFIVWAIEHGLPLPEKDAGGGGGGGGGSGGDAHDGNACFAIVSSDVRTTQRIEAWFTYQVLRSGGVTPPWNALWDWSSATSTPLLDDTPPRTRPTDRDTLFDLHAFLVSERPLVADESSRIYGDGRRTTSEKLDALRTILERVDAADRARTHAIAAAKPHAGLAHVIASISREYQPSEHAQRLTDLLCHAHTNGYASVHTAAYAASVAGGGRSGGRGGCGGGGGATTSSAIAHVSK